MSANVCVCIPARNEADHIGILIDALGSQNLRAPLNVALCVNNSDDDTASIARNAAALTKGQVRLAICECRFESAVAHAGSARRAAIALGADMLGEDSGLLISTDADCRPPADWVAANLAFAGNNYIIGGRIELDEQEASVSPAIFALWQRFSAYWRQVRMIEDSIDPVPWDPVPRHGDHTGASLALSVGLYRRAGGVPLLPSGEDRALVDAAIGAGGRLIHPDVVWTRTSSRIVGRAKAGMACDLQRWIDTQARGETPYVPSFAQWETRARWRRGQREGGSGADLAVIERHLPPMPCDMPLPGAPGL